MELLPTYFSDTEALQSMAHLNFFNGGQCLSLSKSLWGKVNDD